MTVFYVTVILALYELTTFYPTNIYLFKVKNRNTRKKCKTRSKLTTKTPEQSQWRRSGFFVVVVTFEHILHLFLVFLLLTLKKWMLVGQWQMFNVDAFSSLFFRNSVKFNANQLPGFYIPRNSIKMNMNKTTLLKLIFISIQIFICHLALIVKCSFSFA